MNETRLSARIRDELHAAGWYTRKVHQGAMAGSGVPDILAHRAGSPTLYVETKTPKGRFRARQIHVIEKLREAGCLVCTPRTLEEFVAWGNARRLLEKPEAIGEAHA